MSVAEAEVHQVADVAEDGRDFERVRRSAEEADSFVVHALLALVGRLELEDVVERREGDGGHRAGSILLVAGGGFLPFGGGCGGDDGKGQEKSEWDG